MKNLFSKMFTILVVLLFGVGMTVSCTGFEEPDGPNPGGGENADAQLELGEPIVHNAISVDIPVVAKGLAFVGYKVVEKGVGSKPANATLLFRTGHKIEGNPEMINLTGNDGLDRGKEFIVYIAAAVSDTEFYNNGEILSVEFSTPNNYADADVTVLRTSAEGADIYVQVPERVKQQNRRIKWGIANIAMLEYYGQAPIPAKLHCNDVFYPATLFKNDTILEINHYNAYRRGPNGEIGYYYFKGYNANGTMVEGVTYDPNDEKVTSGEATPTQYYQHFQPGEPLVLMMSEVDYADCQELAKLDGQDYIDHYYGKCDENCPENCTTHCQKKHPMIDWGWGPGWYWYPYDYEAYSKEASGDREEGELPMPGVGGGSNQPTIDFDKFWHEGAWYKRLEIRLPGPEEFTTGDVVINTSGLRTDGGKITFTPTGDTFAYFVFICPETSEVGAGYRDLLKYVNNDSSLLQWLTTSEIAPYLSIFPYEGQTIMNLEEILYEIVAGMRYHIIVNAVPGKMVNGDMTLDVSKQKFQHTTFTLPEYTIDEPELIVTPYEAYSPYKVKFNVKNANPSIPVKKIAYAFNYTRDFVSYMSQTNYTYSDIVLANDGYANLSEAEVEQVNSDFGCDVEFDVRENSYSTIAVIGWNEEGRPSNPDKEGSKAVAEAKSTAMPSADPLDMTKLNALKGNWTATADVRTYDYETGAFSTSKKSWNVTIGDLNTNNVFSAADYQVFENAGVNKEAADAYLAEFNKQAADYNALVLGQNRVLCQGWDITGTRETAMTSPWDLFLMPDYNASLVDYLFYDFGPKWFLQTDADGNIFIPVNYNVVPPMMLWFNGMEHYLCSGNLEKGYANYIYPNDPMDVQTVGIPVEIAEDGNTVTLKSITASVSNEGVTEEITLYPTMIYNNQGQLAFYNPYVVSDVVLTKGYTAAPTTSSVATGKCGFGTYVLNSSAFKTPVKHHSRTVFAPAKKMETTIVTKKFATKEEIRQSAVDMFKKQNHLPLK